MSDRFGIGGLITGFIILLCVLPLGIWKMVEIIIWISSNVNINIG